MTFTPRKLLAGALAGAVGTLAMDFVWYGRYRRGGGEDGFTDWESATGTTSFEEASAPAKVGKKFADTVGIDLPDEAAAATTNAMHWLTGVGYGVGHAVLQDGRGLVTGGLLTGAGAYANSYATLGAMGVYEPIWKYDPKTLFKDLTAHLVFGLATTLAYRVLTSDDDEA
jgi:hypothetical protein